MTRLTLWIVLICTLIFVLVLVVFRAQTPNTLPESEIGRCATPCWQGIQPGDHHQTGCSPNQLNDTQGFDPMQPGMLQPIAGGLRTLSVARAGEYQRMDGDSDSARLSSSTSTPALPVSRSARSCSRSTGWTTASIVFRWAITTTGFRSGCPSRTRASASARNRPVPTAFLPSCRRRLIYWRCNRPT